MERHMTVALFDGCGRKERNAIKKLGTTVELEEGRRLTTEGWTGRQFAIVLDGELAVSRDGERIATMRSGDYVGEIALLAGHHTPATATVEAATRTTVWVLSSAEFDEMCDTVPHVCERLSLTGLQRAARNATGGS